VTTPEQLANQIRALLKDVDNKVFALRAHGFQANVTCKPGEDLKLEASRTETTHL
jgi:hypothetical protein